LAAAGRVAACGAQRDCPPAFTGRSRRRNYWLLSRGLIYRGKCEDTPDVTAFAETLERVCIETVEAGHMTSDLPVMIGPGQPWPNTQAFLARLDENLQKAMR
jgi:hypothetical protein